MSRASVPNVVAPTPPAPIARKPSPKRGSRPRPRPRPRPQAQAQAQARSSSGTCTTTRTITPPPRAYSGVCESMVTYQRGQTLAVNFQRPSKACAGYLRLTLVPPQEATDVNAHKRNAYYYSCEHAEETTFINTCDFPDDLDVVDKEDVMMKQRHQDRMSTCSSTTSEDYFGFGFLGSKRPPPCSSSQQNDVLHLVSYIAMPLTPCDGQYLLTLAWFPAEEGPFLCESHADPADQHACQLIRVQGGAPQDLPGVPLSHMAERYSEDCLTISQGIPLSKLPSFLSPSVSFSRPANHPRQSSMCFSSFDVRERPDAAALSVVNARDYGVIDHHNRNDKNKNKKKKNVHRHGRQGPADFALAGQSSRWLSTVRRWLATLVAWATTRGTSPCPDVSKKAVVHPRDVVARRPISPMSPVKSSA